MVGIIPLIFVAEGRGGGHVVQHDVTASPQWQAANGPTHEAILKAARDFLLHCRDERDPEGHRTDATYAGYMAAWLHRAHLLSDGDLHEAVKSHWLWAILEWPEQAKQHHCQMVAIAYRCDADFCTEWVLNELIRNNQADGSMQALRVLGDCWNDEISQLVEVLIMNGHFAPNHAAAMFEVLCRQSRPRRYRCSGQSCLLRRRRPTSAKFFASRCSPSACAISSPKSGTWCDRCYPPITRWP